MITIIDYGMGNLRSVSKALEKVRAKVIVTSDVQLISEAETIVLPGVGAFHHAMKNLRERNILEIIRKSIIKGIPFLGICLGLQLLFSDSEEGYGCSGLNIIAGKVRRFKGNIKVPHMGWNQINIEKETPLLSGFSGSFFGYFAHSYYVDPENKNIVTSTTDYGIDFVSMIQKDNIFATQFHPEKSGEFGLKILKNFCDIASKKKKC